MPSLSNSHRRALAWIVQCAGLLIALGWWGERGLSYPLPMSLESAASEPILLPCVSYSPFRHREGRDDITPFNYLVNVSPAQIETDLRILKTLTNCVRTYGLSQGQDAVPAVARKLGMRVRLGIWLSRDEAQNRLQLNRGIQLANEFKDVVDLLVVGNEVLLRREVSPDALGRYLSEARQRSPVPITYADVWEFWQRHAALAQHVDVVTVHILPYWEDEPVRVSLAADHVLSVAAKMQQQFEGKPIWVGETGWPAAGRQRAGAVPGKVEQSRFLNDLITLADAQKQAQLNSPNFNVIEGFDQPWKRSFEGAMGGYWGLFDQFGQTRVQMGGGITEDTHWWRGFLCATLAGALALLTCIILRLSTVSAVSVVLSAALLGALVPLQWLMMQQWDRSPREMAVSGFLALLGMAVTWVSLQEKSTRTQEALRLTLLFAAATAALVLLLESRYRPFPWWWFLAPTVALWAQRIRMGSWAERAPPEALLMAAVIAVSAVGMMWAEGWRNLQALLYGVLLLLLAAGVLWPWRTRAISASSAAGAQSSVV